MKWALIVSYGSAFLGGGVVGQEALLNFEGPAAADECEAARQELLKVRGYIPDLVKCLPGTSPKAHTK